MRYEFDAELLDLATASPKLFNFEDYVAVRNSLLEMARVVEGKLDLSAIHIDERLIPAHGDGPDVAVTLYRPRNLLGPAPCVLRIHGGGFVVGSVLGDLPLSSFLASSIGAVVVSVEYRLAPEHAFPAALHDCYATLKWIHDSAAELDIDAKRIAVFGSSAGAGLSAGMILMNRDRHRWPIKFLLLDVPELDDRLESASMTRFVDTPIWNRPNAVLSWKYYLGDTQGSTVSPYAAPARAVDLSLFPRTYISIMEFDPLRDEGIEFAKSLLDSGVHVELHIFPGTFHGSVMANHATISKRIVGEIVDTLRRELQN